MPRQGRSGGRGGRAHPSVAPARPAPTIQQTRPATTSAYPPAPTKVGAPVSPVQTTSQSQGSGLLGQMASTAA